jgi:phosphonate degradation associated HDIG domain protein
VKILDEIFTIFHTKGETAYFGEAVSQMEHALQSAQLAVQSGAPDSLVVAALLHDIGHLLHDQPEHIASLGVDAAHELVGEAWLAQRFGAEVTEPVGLHVAAKRYLCAVEPGYLEHLSPASVQSLWLQGGPMTPDEIRAFESRPFYREAVQLRRWDDEAKIPGREAPPLKHYRSLIEAVLAG